MPRLEQIEIYDVNQGRSISECNLSSKGNVMLTNKVTSRNTATLLRRSIYPQLLRQFLSIWQPYGIYPLILQILDDDVSLIG